MSSPDPPAGGFLLSPAPSSTASTIQSSLPTPRSTPLRPGGTKISALIRHLDSQILHIQRRFAKRSTFSPTKPSTGENQMIETSTSVKPDTWGDVKGYTSIREASKDIEELVTIIWISGTPSLQIANLISLASLMFTIITGMPAPVKSKKGQKALFRVLGKLDLAFASLLLGRDVETGVRLPGFKGGGGKGVSGTEKVRIRGVVERTRVGVVEAFRGGEREEDEDGEGRVTEVGSEEDDGELILENGVEGEDEDEEDEDLNVQIARVYDLTMVELGDSLEEPSLGIFTGW